MSCIKGINGYFPCKKTENRKTQKQNVYNVTEEHQKVHLFCVDDDVHFVLHTVDVEVLVRVPQLPPERTVLKANKKHLGTNNKEKHDVSTCGLINRRTVVV